MNVPSKEMTDAIQQSFQCAWLEGPDGKLGKAAKAFVAAALATDREVALNALYDIWKMGAQAGMLSVVPELERIKDNRPGWTSG